MKYTTRQDFPEELPEAKTQYCWHCGAAGAQKVDGQQVKYRCQVCGRSSGRVLIYDPHMQMHFDQKDRLVHESCGVIITRSDGKLLLFKRRKFPYLLTIPAGHLERGEAPLPCAIRETQEEIGITLQNLTELFAGNIMGDSCLGGADIHHWHTYGCIVDENIAVQLDAEGSSWDWYAAQELTSRNTVQPVLYLLNKAPVANKLKALAATGWPDDLK